MSEGRPALTDAQWVRYLKVYREVWHKDPAPEVRQLVDGDDLAHMERLADPYERSWKRHFLRKN